MIHDGVVLAGAASLLYATTISAAAVTALVARTPDRRLAAQDVLKILLRRSDRQ
jgi:hypothetical protein